MGKKLRLNPLWLLEVIPSLIKFLRNMEKTPEFIITRYIGKNKIVYVVTFENEEDLKQYKKVDNLVASILLDILEMMEN